MALLLLSCLGDHRLLLRLRLELRAAQLHSFRVAAAAPLLLWVEAQVRRWPWLTHPDLLEIDQSRISYHNGRSAAQLQGGARGAAADVGGSTGVSVAVDDFL